MVQVKEFTGKAKKLTIPLSPVVFQVRQVPQYKKQTELPMSSRLQVELPSETASKSFTCNTVMSYKREKGQITIKIHFLQSP